MNEKIFPEIINKFNVYKGDDSGDATSPLLGVGNSVTLPNFDEITETLTGAGILGEVEANNPGHYSNVEWELPFVCINENLFEFDSTKREYLTIRASQQGTEKATGSMKYSGIKIIVGGKVKGYELGTIELGKRSESKVKLSVSYFKVTLKEKNTEGAEVSTDVFELDKYNEVFKLKGTDMLADIKAFT